MSDLQFHPLANVFPLLNDREHAELASDIRQRGLLEPIVLLGGLILDGRNRYRACVEAGVEPRFEEYEGNDPASYVVSLNLRRRHLDESQRAVVAAKLANLTHGGDRKSDQAANLPLDRTDLFDPADEIPEPVEPSPDFGDEPPGPSDEEIERMAEVFERERLAEQACLRQSPPVTQAGAARMLNVGERTVRSARRVLDEGAPELVDIVERGKVSVSAAADVATLPKQEQREVVARGEKEILEKAKAIRSERAAQRAEENLAVAVRETKIPEGTFGTIVIDPPWPMVKIERDVRPNQVAFDYPVMSEDELSAFGEKVARIAADDCHLFMWTTQKFLPLALRLLDAWGFRHVLTMVWHKPGGFQPIGLPQYNCEFAVYARRGAPSFAETKAFPCCFEAPRREHSRKPDEFYDLIRRVTPGPRIDVFSREPRDGFAQFGNESDKFAEAI